MDEKVGFAMLTPHARLAVTIIALAFVLAAPLTFGSGFTVEVGGYPAARLMIDKPVFDHLVYDTLLYSQFTAKIDVFPWLYVSGATTVYFYPYYDKLSFFPFFALFLVGGGVQFGPITVAYEHRCDHAVVPYSFVDDPLVGQDSGYDKVFVRYEVKF